MDNNPNLHSEEAESDNETAIQVVLFTRPGRPDRTDFAYSLGDGVFAGSFGSVVSAVAMLEATTGPDPPILDVPQGAAIRNEDVLPSKFVQDHHLTNNVLAQISRIASNDGERQKMYALLYSENRGIYYCVHEVCEKGKLASQALHPGQSECPVRGANCSFMVKVVRMGSGSKFQVFNPTVAIPDAH